MTHMPDLLGTIPPPLLAKLDELTSQHDALDRKLSDPAVLGDHRAVRDAAIKKAALQPVVADYRELRRLATEAAELRAVAAAPGDAELAALAAEELPQVESRAAAVLDRVKKKLVRSEEDAVASVILELRA